MLFSSITKCDMDVRRGLYGNILLSGSSTLSPDLEERILKEMHVLVPSGMFVKIIAISERKYSLWVGASILSCLTSFKPMWITRRDYRDFGAQEMLLRRTSDRVDVLIAKHEQEALVRAD
ncbi:hypothetical protein ASZ78_009819 [Callipepla squamata]|uniref:Uncharacterized protein n=1 Tax=Callipepla squamata TaxID=9009 RepID=A0A226MMT4_CALSU|nr:hypothetical protein ASZ78_009819 [Callipepla squamata]